MFAFLHSFDEVIKTSSVGGISSELCLKMWEDIRHQIDAIDPFASVHFDDPVRRRGEIDAVGDLVAAPVLKFPRWPDHMGRGPAPGRQAYRFAPTF
ncbi:hypothetical protein [Mesorhizobium sp.]|uniref:hypothetical protein n=1 Tax=Mesorhizobium sp. TaxID=1871066 RepID=UPI00257981A0|nr:hypothetical protein [Mesorhizobium sp.]